MRMIRSLTFVLFTVAASFLVADQTVKLTYLANEGFLIESGNQKVLIDALFGEGLSGYPAVPADIRRQMENGEGPFAGVDVVLASHFHPDHFSPDAVGNYLLQTKESRFYSTRDAEGKLRKAYARFSEIQDRVTGIMPDAGGRNTFEHKDIRLTAFPFHHGEGSGVQNIGWLIEIGGLRLLHAGDTEVSLEDVKPYRLSSEKIDIVLLPSWFYVYDQFQQVIQEISARKAVVMHIPSPDAPSDYFGDAGSFEGVLKLVRGHNPNAWIPLRPLESRDY